MTKSLTEIIKDLSEYNSRGATRVKALEAVKARSCEWPSTSDDFQRLIISLCETIRCSRGPTLSHGLAALDFVVDDFGKALTASLSAQERDNRAPFPATGRAVQLAAWALTDARSVVAEADGALEYACKLIRSLVSSLLHANNVLQSFTSSIAAALVYGLLEFPTNRPRHFDLVKSTVTVVMKSYPFDFDSGSVGKLIEAIDNYIAKAGRVAEVLFGIQLLWDLSARAPLESREALAFNRPELGLQATNRIVSVLIPSMGSSEKNSQLISVCVETLRILLTCLASSGSVDVSSIANLEELQFCLEHELHEDPTSLPTADLLVDVLLIRKEGFSSVYKYAVEEKMDDVLIARVIERWAQRDHQSHPNAIEEMLNDLYGKSCWLSLAVTIQKVFGLSHISGSILSPSQEVIDITCSINPSKGMLAMVEMFFDNCSTSRIESLEKGSLSFLVATAAVSNLLESKAKILSWISEHILLCTINKTTATVLCQLLAVTGTRNCPEIFIKLSPYVSVTTLMRTVLAIHKEPLRMIPLLVSQPASLLLTDVDMMRECLALRGPPRMYKDNTDSVSTSYGLGKCFKFFERLLWASLKDDDWTTSGHSRLTSAYILLGSVDITVVACDSCLLTSCLSRSSSCAPSSGILDLKNAIAESTRVLVGAGIKLCLCEVHKDVAGEPRSLLSQVPSAMTQFIDRPPNSQNIVVPSTKRDDEDMNMAVPINCITMPGRVTELKKRLKRSNEVFDYSLVEEISILRPTDSDVVGILNLLFHDKHVMNNSIIRSKFGLLIGGLANLEISDSYDWLVCSRLSFTPSMIGQLKEGGPISVTIAAVRLSAISCSVSIREKADFFAPILADGTYAMYAIDALTIIEPQHWKTVFLVSVIKTLGSAPDDLVNQLGSECDCLDIIEGIRYFITNRRPKDHDGIGFFAAQTLLTGQLVTNSEQSIVRLVDTCFRIEQVLNIANISIQRSVAEIARGLKLLNNRFWLWQFWTNKYSIETGESMTKKLRLSRGPIGKPCEWPISIQMDRSLSSSSIDSLCRSYLFALVWGHSIVDYGPLACPLAYNIQSLVGQSHTVLVKQIIDSLFPEIEHGPDPIDLKLPIDSWNEYKSEYPINRTCALAVSLCCAVFQNDNQVTVRYITTALCVKEQLAARCIGLFILMAATCLDRSVTASAVSIINKAILAGSSDVAANLVQAINTGKRVEFNCRQKLSLPGQSSVLFDFINQLSLVELANLCLGIDALFLESLVARSPIGTDRMELATLSLLFSEPSPWLRIILLSLEKLGTRINSLSLSLHPSVRALAAQLRNDPVAILFEPDQKLVTKGLNMLGVEVLNEWDPIVNPIIAKVVANKPVPDDQFFKTSITDSSIASILTALTSTSRLNFLSLTQSVLEKSAKGSVPITCLEVAQMILKESRLYPPSVSDERNICLAQLVKAFRKHGRFAQGRFLADWTIQNSVSLTTNPGTRIEIFYQLAKCLWQLGQTQEAVRLISALSLSEDSGRLDNVSVRQSVPRVLARATQWIGQLRLETIDDIRNKYLNKCLAHTDDVKSIIKAKIRYVKVIDPIVADPASSSQNVLHKQLIIEEFKLLCDIVCSTGAKSGGGAWFASRIVSLWFTQPATCSPIIGQYRAALSSSGGLLPFFYQIASRMGGAEVSNEFRKELILFIIECAKKFPHVCLPPILQLRQLSGLNSKNVTNAKIEQERSKQAEVVIDKLLKTPETTGIVQAMIAAFKFYFNLAMTKVDIVKQVGQKRNVTDIDGYREYALAITQGQVATVLTSAEYCVIRNINTEFSVTDSGKSVPKILTVIDNNGRMHKQIVKGNDDLRNDAVLQQLFSLLDSVTSASMRSYKVVPITACAGIAEWVADTTTLGSYLAGYPDETTGAHSRYFPNDLSPSTVKAKMVHVRQQNSKSGNDAMITALLATYKSCCAKFSPCMRFFFHENFASPKEWFTAQFKFSNSVATTSIVGFIVGLGDRHPNNILLDTKTGEVVHIDYGICFDAGRLLKIPEHVPFRLTRDMVDGLGSLGIQGPFAKICEDTLISLKKNSALVTAVVEVFVVDPLFNWAVASLGSDNAQVALEGVKRKLQGFLDSTDVIPLTPSAQVDRLIRSATDPRILSQMFAGWQPWL